MPPTPPPPPSRRPPPRTRYDKAVRRALLSLVRPLAPLLTCCLLAGLGAGARAGMGAPVSNPTPLLDRTGNLVNVSSSRRHYHLHYGVVLTAPAAAAASKSSSSASSGAGDGRQCQLLTQEGVERLCDQLDRRRLVETSRRLRFCDMFDFRKLLGFATTLVETRDDGGGEEEAAVAGDCAALLLSGEPGSNKTLCEACLTALVSHDRLAKERAAEQASVLDKYQCTVWAPTPNTAAAVGVRSTTVPSLSSTLSTPTTLSPFSVYSSVSPVDHPAATAAAAAASTERPSPTSQPRQVDGMTDVPMAPHTHAGSSDCAACKLAYKGWLCSVMFEVRPFASRQELSQEARMQRVLPCDSWCAAVETECPYFTPSEDQQNGGEPLFLCREADYHDSSLYPMSKVKCDSGTHRHSCCYTPKDVRCLDDFNATCPSLEERCIRPASTTTVPAPNATAAASTTTQQTVQQSQYSPPEANESSVEAANFSATAASSSGSCCCCWRTSDLFLLLTLMVAYCCWRPGRFLMLELT